MKRYLILYNTSLKGLKEGVNLRNSEGYIPIGGVTYIPAIPQGEAAKYLQAMYRPEPEAL